MLLRGFVRIRISRGSCERFLNLCKSRHIVLWDVIFVKDGYEASLSLRDFYRLRPLARKCHTRVRICQKYGFPFFLYRYRKRRAFALGICCSGIFIFLLSCFIWNIRVEGNHVLTKNTVLSYLESHSVGYGNWKYGIDCKQLAKQLRSDFPTLTWVSVRLSGTTLELSVKENPNPGAGEAATEKNAQTTVDPPTDLISKVDGTVISMITRKGTPLVSVGAEVTAGQPLVSGRMEITDDSGAVVRYEYCQADADIYIQTQIPYRDRFSMIYQAPFYTGHRRYAGYLTILGHSFGIGLPRSPYGEYDIETTEYPCEIKKDFFLPLDFHLVTAREYRTETRIRTETEARELAEQHLEKFLTEKEEKGVQISEKNVRIEMSLTSCKTSGVITALVPATDRSDTPILELDQEGMTQ